MVPPGSGSEWVYCGCTGGACMQVWQGHGAAWEDQSNSELSKKAKHKSVHR